MIYITGILITIKQINAPLNTPQESVEIRKDSLKYNKVNSTTV